MGTSVTLSMASASLFSVSRTRVDTPGEGRYPAYGTLNHDIHKLIRHLMRGRYPVMEGGYPTHSTIRRGRQDQENIKQGEALQGRYPLQPPPCQIKLWLQLLHHLLPTVTV